MKYRVLIQPTAKVELREAYRCHYNQSPSAAEKWLGKLLKAVETLSQNPERCARAPEDDAFEETIRQRLYGKRRGNLPDFVHHLYPGHPNRSARIGLDADEYFPARELRELGCFFRRPRCRHETCLPGRGRAT